MRALLRLPRMGVKAILAALPAALLELAEQAAFRIYITDCFYLMGQNKYFTKRFAEIIDVDEGRRAPTAAEVEALAAKWGITFWTPESNGEEVDA